MSYVRRWRETLSEPLLHSLVISCVMEISDWRVESAVTGYVLIVLSHLRISDLFENRSCGREAIEKQIAHFEIKRVSILVKVEPVSPSVYHHV